MKSWLLAALLLAPLLLAAPTARAQPAPAPNGDDSYGYAGDRPVSAAPAPQGSGDRLSNPDAFERGFVTSLYDFDACGDQLGGRLFRRALAERFAQCPFTPEARARFTQQTRMDQVRARRFMAQAIEETGGLPRQLPGAPLTCRQLQATDAYQSLRARLDAYAQGRLQAQALIPAPCDADDVMP